jgi:acetyl-CoA carboxylase biotin carboxylase subunit
MTTGVDLVQAMLRIAGGEPLAYRQSDIACRGHAIEVRINAEDPARQFMPSPGRVARFRAPEGEGVRFDTMLYEGYVVPPFYDSLLGKLIVAGASREEALGRLRTALKDLLIEGLATTRGLHLALLDDEDIHNGAVHTRWLEDWLPLHLPAISRAA